MEDMLPYFASILEQDPAPVVICNMSNDIIYMNPAAIENYSDDGGEILIGRCILDCHPPAAAKGITRVVEWFAKSKENNLVHTMHSDRRDVYMIALRDTDGNLIGYYEKHEYRTPDLSSLYAMR